MNFLTYLTLYLLRSPCFGWVIIKELQKAKRFTNI